MAAARTLPPLRSGPLIGGVRPAAPLFRFFSHIAIVVDGDGDGDGDGKEHWLWTAGCTNRGAPRFTIDGHHHSAHRWSYIQFRGPLPPGTPVEQVCGRRLCVHPDCLRPARPTGHRGHRGRR